jgi:class 3 adenylate cyclase
MLLTKRLSIQSKLVILLLLVSIGSMFVISVIGYTSGREALEQSVYHHLTSVRAARADQLQTRVKLIRAQAITLSEDRMVLDAMGEFLKAYRDLDQHTLSAAEEEKLKAYYRDDFLPDLASHIDSKPALESYLPASATARYLQYHYIASNPHPYSRTEQLDQAGDGSDYSRVHQTYHPLLRNIARNFGYEDILLVDPGTGDVVYSVAKTTEFATSLRTGPYAETNLGELIRGASKSKDPGDFHTVGFERYRPKLGRPASFVASPIADGPHIIGILVFQFPIDEINRVLTGNMGWERDGLGQTGEVYLVRADHLMLSMSRFYYQDPESYLASLQQAGYPASQVERIRRAGTTILVQEDRSPTIGEALAGKTGTEIHVAYRNKPALISYAPLEVEGYRWVIVAKMDVDEAFAPVRAFGRRVAVTVAAVTLGVSLLAILLSSLLVRPIQRLIDGARRVSAGQVDDLVDVGTHDEFRELADSFNEMTRNLKAQSELAEQKTRESEELLLNILPGPAAARLRHGEEQISERHADITVLFADVVGFTELAESVPADRAVGLLNDLVTAFDEVAERHGVEKVRTVGSSYLAVCGLSVQRPDHTRRMVEFGLDLLHIVRRFNLERAVNLGARVGINTGPVVGGVVGRTRFIYDLWGATVNVARGLAEGEVNTVRVTQTVHDRLSDLYDFEGPLEFEVPGERKRSVWSVRPDTPSRPADSARATVER